MLTGVIRRGVGFTATAQGKMATGDFIGLT